MSNLDFLPEDYIERKAQQRTNIICLSLFLIVLAGVAGGFAVTESRQERVDQRLTAINDEMKQADQSLRQLEVLEQKRHEMMKKASISASLMEPVPRSLLVATVTNDLPSGVSLRSFELTSTEVKPAADTAAARRTKKVVSSAGSTKPQTSVEPKKWQTSLEIVGLAPSDLQVAEFVRRLHRCSLFGEIALVFSEEQKLEEETLRHFKLVVQLDPEARASESDVQLARTTNVSGM